MFVVKNINGKTVAYCSRKQDAFALANTDIDGHTYIVEKVKND
jgi:hypothetical protein